MRIEKESPRRISVALPEWVAGVCAAELRRLECARRMTEDLVVIGGGVMGLFTAYHASERVERVVVLERGRIGDPMTASFGRTRSLPQRLPRSRLCAARA